MRIKKRIYIVLICVITVPIAGQSFFDPSTQKYAFLNCTVITMSGAGVLKNQDVLINGDRIELIAGAGSFPIPNGYTSIYSEGKYLLPGLIDMHVHLSGRENLNANLRYGVTSVLQMSGQRGQISDFLKLRADIASGKLKGPRLFLTGPMFDRLGYTRQTTAYAMNEDDVPDVLNKHIAAGYDFIKVHNFTPLSVYRYLVEKSSIPVIGHIPMAVPLDEGLSSQIMVAHSGIFYGKLFYDPSCTDHFWVCMSNVNVDMSIMNKLVEKIVTSGRYITANLAYLATEKSNDDDWNAVLNDPEFAYLDPAMKERWRRDNPIARGERRIPARKAIDNQSKFDYVLLKRLNDMGVSILAGSDMGVEGIFPGKGLHIELTELTKAGLTPIEALRTATSTPGRFFKEYVPNSPDLGQVREGFAADLLLLDANPLDDIDNLSKINGVMSSGKWFTSEELVREIKESHR